MSDNAEYPQRHVAFIDILGFRNKVSQIARNAQLFDEIRNLHKAIQILIKGAEHVLPIARLLLNELKATAFSDSIVISVPASDMALVYVIDVVMRFCRVLLSRGALSRGGISSGPLFHQDGILFGDALIKAYDIERNVAKFPRIVVDPVLVRAWNAAISQKLLSGNRGMLIRDSDGVYIADIFHASTLLEDWHLEFYKHSRISLESMLQSQDVGLSEWTKIVWMVERFNEAVQKNGFTPAIAIPEFSSTTAEA